MFPLHGKDAGAVTLAREDETPGPQGLFDERQVGGHVLRPITHLIAGVERVVGGVAHAPHSCEDPVDQPGMTPQLRVL